MLREPLLKLASFTIGATSGTQGTIIPFGDFDSLVVKAYGTLTGTSPTQDIWIQSSDDGGTTYYDNARLARFTGTVTAANALWTVIPIGGATPTYVGAAAAGGITGTSGSVNGLPLLSKDIQIKNTIGGTIGTSALTISLYAATQSGSF